MSYHCPRCGGDLTIDGVIELKKSMVVVDEKGAVWDDSSRHDLDFDQYSYMCPQCNGIIDFKEDAEIGATILGGYPKTEMEV